jgi:hypothetical protein
VYYTEVVMDAIDRMGVSLPGFPRMDPVKRVSPEAVPGEDLCIDVEEMKQLFFMMRGISVDSDSENRDHWA